MTSNGGARTKKAYINAGVTLITHISQTLIGFVIQKMFIDYLGIDYLGYNSVFQNLLQMLNLADLGIGVAITSFLYKPLAVQDKRAISTLMYMYKKIYNILGIVVLSIGLFLTTIIGFIITDANCSLGYLRGLFLINLAGTVSTYYLAYKRTLLIADQKAYITSLIDTAIYFIMSLLQVIILIFFPNYILFLCITVTKNIVANIIISVQCRRRYDLVGKEFDDELMKEYKPQIVRYVKDVFISKIGAYVYYSTDNIIISVFKGSLLTGYLSNYTMIIGHLNIVVTQVLSSIQATFGNYINTTQDKNAKLRMTDNYFCVNFCIGNFCMICFVLLVQPFIKFFFGENLLLPFSTALWLGINLMLTILIQLPSQMFIICRLYKYDKPIIIVSAILNIVLSMMLVNIMGINGVLIGTFVTSLIYLFSRFYIIAKYVYEIKYWYYVKKILMYGIISILSFSITNFVVRNLNGNGVIGFVILMVVIGVLAFLTTTFMLGFTNEFEFFKRKILPDKIRNRVNSLSIGAGCVLIIVICLIFGDGSEESFLTYGNKSYERTDSYTEEINTGRKVFSLSFDDTIIIFKDIIENKPNSIFENETLNWYKYLHDKYGVVISCYVYYGDESFDLTQFPTIYKKEFVANSDWLRFGFHSINANTNYENGSIKEDYVKTVDELERIVGNESIDNVIRLHMFQGSYEEIKILTELEKEPLRGLFSADDKRNSYYLSEENNNYIYSHDEYYDSDLNLFFFSTDFRTEYVDNIDKKMKEFGKECWNNQKGDLVVFSHEWGLNIQNKEKIEEICKYAKSSGYRMEFFEDVIY